MKTCNDCRYGVRIPIPPQVLAQMDEKQREEAESYLRCIGLPPPVIGEPVQMVASNEMRIKNPQMPPVITIWNPKPAERAVKSDRPECALFKPKEEQCEDAPKTGPLVLSS